jgi:hypothetical protein
LTFCDAFCGQKPSICVVFAAETSRSRLQADEKRLIAPIKTRGGQKTQEEGARKITPFFCPSPNWLASWLLKFCHFSEIKDRQNQSLRQIPLPGMHKHRKMGKVQTGKSLRDASLNTTTTMGSRRQPGSADTSIDPDTRTGMVSGKPLED